MDHIALSVTHTIIHNEPYLSATRTVYMRVLATTDFNAISYPLAHPGFHFVGITMVAVDCVIGLTRMVGEC